jgi:uncharacterized membrane protein (UPF0127 family)
MTVKHPPRIVSLSRLAQLVMAAIILTASVQLVWAWWPKSDGRAETSVYMPTGAHLRLTLASSAEERARGLGDRNELPHDGLLLVWPTAGQHPIWMHKMRFPLDLVWCNRDSRIVSMKINAPICASENDCPLYGLEANDASAVLELRAGSITNLDLKVGEQLQIAPLTR